jgi:hypothetical protein
MTDPTDDGEAPLVFRDVDWSQCHVQLTAYGFEGTRRSVPELNLASTVIHAIERMHNAPSRPFVGAYLLEACRDAV